jgi:uncharacterized protein
MTVIDAQPAAKTPARRQWFGRRLRFAAGAFLLLLVVDLARAPERQLSARVLLAGIHFWQGEVAPVRVAAGARCRFQPSCSRYAEAAIRRDGALVGSLRAVWRILRCGPWTAKGTLDEP